MKSSAPNVCTKHGKASISKYYSKNKFIYVCRKCRNDRNKTKRSELKAQYVKKLGGKCSKCGYRKNHKALHFHHYGQKQITISRAILNDTKKVEQELSNCKLLCASCHQKEHSEWTKDLTKVASIWHWRKINLYKAFGGSCYTCNGKELSTLQFHHLDPTTKRFTLSSVSKLKKNPETIWSEALKCVLLCANCHIEVEDGLHNQKMLAAQKEAPHNLVEQKTWLHMIDRISNKYKISKDGKISLQQSKNRYIKNNKCSDCGRGISKKSKTCRRCMGKRSHKIIWPSKKHVTTMVCESNYSAVARELGVSDNAVRKYIKSSK